MATTPSIIYAPASGEGMMQGEPRERGTVGLSSPIVQENHAGYCSPYSFPLPESLSWSPTTNDGTSNGIDIFPASGMAADSTEDEENYMAEASEATASEQERTITSKVPWNRGPALTGESALRIWQFLSFASNEYKDDSVVDWIKKLDGTGLINTANALWLISIMEPLSWVAIESHLVKTNFTIADLEGEITTFLQCKKQAQAPRPFDINRASKHYRRVLEAHIKALVEKQQKLYRDRRDVEHFRKISIASKRPFFWNSAARGPRKIRPREMISVSEEVMQSCEVDEAASTQ